MTYQEMYNSKLTSAENAVKVIKSGDWVDYTWCINHPIELDKALAYLMEKLEEELFGPAATDYARAAEIDARKTEAEERLLEIYEEIGV